MTTPQTVAGAIRARLITVFPDLQVFRNEAPEGTDTPVVIITDGLSVQSEDLGDDLLLTEQVQVDLYIDYAQVTNWADQIHAALHRAPISIPGSQIHRCLVTERVNQPADAGNEDGVERITFTVLVRRRMSATEYGNLPIQPTPTLLEIHEAQTTNVHGIANTAELETQTGAQAKADNAQGNAIAASNAYTDVAAAAAQANAIAISKNYTNNEVVKLTNGTTDFESAQFNLVPGAPAGIGELTWNDTDGTLDLGLKGGNVTLQIGQENVQMVHNSAGVALTDGQAVYVYGSTAGRLSVKLAQANSEANSSKTFGIVTEPIGNNNNGFVTYSGLVRNVNTSAFPEGAALWLSPTTPGALTHIKPQAPNHGVLMGWCVRSHATVGVIFVHVQNGLELDELHNVLINNPVDGQVLSYNATSGLWEAVTFTGGGDPAGTAAALVAAHEAALDPHGDRAYTDAEINALSTVYEPLGASDAAVAAHVAASDPHGDRAYTDAEIVEHTTAVDPHGDRAYADGLAVNYAPATEISPTAITGTAVITSDPRLSDARTPLAHAASHANGGSDEIAVAPAQITQAGATTGQTLTWNGTAWVPQTPSGGAVGGTYQGAWAAGSTYSGNTMVTYQGSMYAATGTPTAGTLPAVTYNTFNSNLTGADWTRINVALLASPAITMVNNTTNTISQAYNNTANILDLSARSGSTVRINQSVDFSITGTADGIMLGFYPSAFTPTVSSAWFAQTTAMSVFIDIFNSRISLQTNGSIIQQAANPSLRTASTSVFDNYRAEWSFTSTNTTVVVFRNNVQVASFTFTQNANQVSVREGLAAVTGGSAGVFRAQNYSRTGTPIVNTGWQRLFTLP